jgi:hypothetical protein
LIKPRRPWKTVEDVEIATLEYVDWSTTDACMRRAGTSHWQLGFVSRLRV